MKKAKKTNRKQPYICVYADYLDNFAPYSYEERGRLITAMLEYMMLDKLPEFTGSERYIWPSLRNQLDRDREAYEARCKASRENGAKGGRPGKKETQGFSEKPKKPNKKEKKNEKENENENEKENEKNRERESDRMPPGETAASDTPTMLIPTVAEVYDFCLNEDCHVDPFRFVDYYSAIGWQLGGSPIRDWRPLVRRWNDSEDNAGYST